MGLVTQTLWNWLVPELFAGPMLTYWQALGLLALTKILFWSFGGKGGGHGGHHWKYRYNGPWGYYMAEKWQGMSPEDKEKFKQKMKEKWCYTEKAPADENSGVSNG